jgi:hypothetical protein
MLGFCASGLTSSIISFLCFEFASLIYMVDTIYIIYSLCFALASLLFIIASSDIFSHLCANLAIIQLVALSNYYFIYKYYRRTKRWFIIHITLKNTYLFLHSPHSFTSRDFLSMLHNKHLSKYCFSYISSKNPLSSNSYNLSPSPI